MADEGFAAMQKMRLEKDLQELQSLIDKHFKQRSLDDKDLAQLKTKIETRKEERAKAIEQRQKRDQERLQREKEERTRREEEEKQKKLEEEERKREAIAQMSTAGKGAQNERRQGGRRQTEKEKKRKVLAERRKPLNVDHLDREKIVVKIKELYDYLFDLEGIKYDYEGDVIDRQRYEITQRRARAQRYSEKLLGRKQQEREKARKNKANKVNLMK